MRRPKEQGEEALQTSTTAQLMKGVFLNAI
jgi:hypothetical protein